MKNLKTTAAAIIVVFILWVLLDFFIHGVILMGTYQATAQFWRPFDQIKMGLLRVVTLVTAAAFVFIYARLIAPKSLKNGLLFGLAYGIAVGIGMGYGTYAMMPIPYSLALTWFLGAVVEALAIYGTPAP